MQGIKRLVNIAVVAAVLIGVSQHVNATARKVHVVGLGATKRVPYSKVGDPAGAATGENALKIRPLVVDGLVKGRFIEDDDTDHLELVVRAEVRKGVKQTEISLEPIEAAR